MKSAMPPSGFQEEGAYLLPLLKGQVLRGSSQRARRPSENESSISRVSHEDWLLRPRDRTNWTFVDSRTDEDIAKAVADDPDAGPLDTDWSNAFIVVPKSKTAISLRIDSEVYDYFKSTGKGFQTRINAVLKSYMDHQKRGK
jgi:uncharacterized protein (DUF4415 family)